MWNPKHSGGWGAHPWTPGAGWETAGLARARAPQGAQRGQEGERRAAGATAPAFALAREDGFQEVFCLFVLGRYIRCLRARLAAEMDGAASRDRAQRRCALDPAERQLSAAGREPFKNMDGLPKLPRRHTALLLAALRSGREARLSSRAHSLLRAPADGTCCKHLAWLICSHCPRSHPQLLAREVASQDFARSQVNPCGFGSS